MPNILFQQNLSVRMGGCRSGQRDAAFDPTAMPCAGIEIDLRSIRQIIVRCGGSSSRIVARSPLADGQHQRKPRASPGVFSSGHSIALMWRFDPTAMPWAGIENDLRSIRQIVVQRGGSSSGIALWRRRWPTAYINASPGHRPGVFRLGIRSR
jgi:hypothetical protein